MYDVKAKYIVNLDVSQVSNKLLTFTPDTNQPSQYVWTVSIKTSFSYSGRDSS